MHRMQNDSDISLSNLASKKHQPNPYEPKERTLTLNNVAEVAIKFTWNILLGICKESHKRLMGQITLTPRLFKRLIMLVMQSNP